MAKKKKKKTSWYAYGGRPSAMNNLIPKANFGQTIGSVGDTDIAKNLDMVIPGLGTGVDAALDLAGFFGDKKEYKDAKENAGEASAYIQAINSGPNKGNLNFSESISGAEATQNKFMNMEQPNFFKDFVAPTAMSVASSAAGGGLGDMNNILPKNLRSSESLLNTVAGEGGGANKAASILANRSSTEDGTGLMMEDVWSAGIQGPARPDGTYAMGGAPQQQDLYEAEGNEVIQHSPGAPPGTTGQMEPIGNNPMLSELKGKSHASGGEMVDGGAGDQVVFSTKLKSDVWKTSFADAAKKIGKKIEHFENKASEGDHITKQTADAMIKSWIVKLQELQIEQESKRKNKFMELLNDGASLEELETNFPDLTKQFMESQGQQTQTPEFTNATEAQFLYGGKPKYAYGNPVDPNDPPFYAPERTDESVPGMQNTFLNEGGMQIYSGDQGIMDYINSIGLEEFGNQWMSNMDPELLEMAGVNEFGDIFENGGDKLKLLQEMYNQKNEGTEGFTPIPVDKGPGKFGEYSMSMAGWEDLQKSATNPGPVNPDGDGTDDETIDLGEIEDPLADDDGITEEEEIITNMDDIVLTPDMEKTDPPLNITELDIEPEEEEEEDIEIYNPNDEGVNLEKEPVGPVATGDPTLDWGYQINPDPNDGIGDEIVLTDEGPGPTRLEPRRIDEIPIDYNPELIRPNNQTPPGEGGNDIPYFEPPYNDLVAEGAGLELGPPPRKKETPITLDPIQFEGFPSKEGELIKPPKDKWKAQPTNDPMFGPFPKNDPKDPTNKKKKKEIEEIQNITDENTEILKNSKSTKEQKMQAFGAEKFFGSLSKYMSPFYNFMKSKEGAEIEPKQNNPYEREILQDMDQRVDIQPWLNQNMMAMKGGMDFSKDFAGGNPMQMFSMYNRLNQGKMTQDSAAWKYKHDTEGKLKTARSNMMYNLGESDRRESGRVSTINSQNRAAVDKHLSTAIEQMSAIGQMDEYTANLMKNDKLRESFITAMAPDIDKYLKNNPNTDLPTAVSEVTKTYSEEEIAAMFAQIGMENVTINPANTNTNEGPTPTNNNTSNQQNLDFVNEPDTVGADITGSDVLSGNTNPTPDYATNISATIEDNQGDIFGENTYNAEINSGAFTIIEGTNEFLGPDDLTYVKVKYGDDILFIEKQDAIQQGLI